MTIAIPARTVTAVRTAGTVGLLAVACLAGTGSVRAATVDPIFHEGNVQSCPDGYLEFFFGGPQDDATDSATAGGMTVEATFTGGGTTLAFEATGGVVNIAFVKGGDNYHEYSYGPVGVTADEGLISPDNGGGNTPQVSHAILCGTAAGVDTEPTPAPAEPTPTPDEPTPTPEEPTPTPTGEVRGDTGTPDPTLPPTDTSRVDGQGPNGLAPIALLLAALGVAAALTTDRARARATR